MDSVAVSGLQEMVVMYRERILKKLFSYVSILQGSGESRRERVAANVHSFQKFLSGSQVDVVSPFVC